MNKKAGGTSGEKKNTADSSHLGIGNMVWGVKGHDPCIKDGWLGLREKNAGRFKKKKKQEKSSKIIGQFESHVS